MASPVRVKRRPSSPNARLFPVATLHRAWGSARRKKRKGRAAQGRSALVGVNFRTTLHAPGIISREERVCNGENATHVLFLNPDPAKPTEGDLTPPNDRRFKPLMGNGKV